MSRLRVLLDTNIIVSGLVFKGGNEYRILECLLDGGFSLVLPGFVQWESRRILDSKFGGLGSLFDLFLSRIMPEVVEWEQVAPYMDVHRGVLRDSGDLPILAALLYVKPDYVVTGDKGLREDLNNFFGSVFALSSVEFLEVLRVS